MYKVPEYIDEPEFVIMNRDALYYQGLEGGDINWTHEFEDAKKFSDPYKISALKRWKPWEQMQIVYV